MLIRISQIAVVLHLAFVSAGIAQVRCDPTQSGITVYGAIANPIHLDPKTLFAMTTTTVRGLDHQGKASVFEGVLLSSILERAGAPLGASLRGRANQLYLRIEARDNYAAVLALAEADTSFRAQVPIIAWKQNGAPLDSLTGPFQLIVPDDRRHGRWVRQVACVRVASALESAP